MKVLIACEESQTVCKAFRARGHEAYSCDIQEPSGGRPEWHVLGDAIQAMQGGTVTTMDGIEHDIGRWDLLIAHPPCTYLSNAGACRLYPRKGVLDEERYAKGLEAKAFFMRFYNADIQRIAVENPVSSKVFDMPPHTQEIQPWMFGHPYTKKTRLWLKGLPPLHPTDVVEPIGPYVPSGTGRKNREKYGAAKQCMCCTKFGMLVNFPPAFEKRYAIWCWGCGYRAPKAFTRRGAARKWNKQTRRRGPKYI